MNDFLKPHRNLEAEVQLKTMIQEIESLMYEPKNNAKIENMLKEANKIMKAPNRVLDLDVIEHYEGWTDLDGLVEELTMEVPKLDNVSKADFSSIVHWIRNVIKMEQETGNIRIDYLIDFYRAFFTLNFPKVHDIDLLDEIFQDTSLEELVTMAFSDI